MTKVNVYLLFDGKCEETFNFCRSEFKTEFTMLSRYNEAPTQEGHPPVPEEGAKNIVHV